MWKVQVNGLPPSLNQFYSGRHWSVRSKYALEWHRIFKDAISHLPSKLKTPIGLLVESECKRKRDCSNTVIAAKFFEDCLVENGYIEDDGPDFVKEVRLRSIKSKVDRTTITIYEV